MQKHDSAFTNHTVLIPILIPIRMFLTTAAITATTSITPEHCDVLGGNRGNGRFLKEDSKKDWSQLTEKETMNKIRTVFTHLTNDYKRKVQQTAAAVVRKGMTAKVREKKREEVRKKKDVEAAEAKKKREAW